MSLRFERRWLNGVLSLVYYLRDNGVKYLLIVSRNAREITLDYLDVFQDSDAESN